MIFGGGEGYNSIMQWLEDRLRGMSFPYPHIEELWTEPDFARLAMNAFLKDTADGATFTSRVMDISQMEDAEIRLILREFFPVNEDVHVFWFGSEFGIRIPSDVFCDFYDDLWYPASDDVLIADIPNKRGLVISHEEELTFWERRDF